MFLGYTYAGPSLDAAVLHTEEESYRKALESGHKDTPSAEVWEAEEAPKKKRKAAE